MPPAPKKYKVRKPYHEPLEQLLHQEATTCRKWRTMCYIKQNKLDELIGSVGVGHNHWALHRRRKYTKTRETNKHVWYI